MAALMFFLFSLKLGFCAGQPGPCRPFCSESECVALHQEKVDFQAAEEACRNRKGELEGMLTGAAGRSLAALIQELHGDVWIGLRLPAGTCSNLSAPLRGYERTAATPRTRSVPSPGVWAGGEAVCSPSCVSLSGDRRWTERPCSDRIGGYLCRTARRDACQVQGLSDSSVFTSAKGCSTGPCQHTCTDVKGGFKCSCFKGYAPDSRDPTQCRLHCSQQKCPAVCEGGAGHSCSSCPDGFILGDSFCHDIDECSMGECEQECSNTYGGFVCSCGDGFVLKDTVKCVNATQVTGVVRPTSSSSSNMVTGSSASSGRFLWLWIFITLAVVASIFLIRFYVVRKQKSRNQQSGVPADNPEA